MDSAVLFFELGYLFNILGTVILIRNIRMKKHIEGISYYTQILFAISNFAKIFYFPHTVLWESTFGWIEFFASQSFSIILLLCLRKYKRISITQEKNYFDYRALILVSGVLAFISNYEPDNSFEWSQFAIRFSILLEALGLLPQIRLMHREKFVQKFMGYYLFFLCLSRICRILFWGFQLQNDSSETYYTLIIADVFYIVLTADFIYTFIKHLNNNEIPYN